MKAGIMQAGIALSRETHAFPVKALLVGMTLLITASGTLLAGGAQEAIMEGNALYEQAKYAEAARKYRAALEIDPLDAAAHYDLGNAHYRGGSLGRAIASYQRAFDLSPRDADIRHNLDLALKRAGESLIPPGMPKAVFILFNLLSRTELPALHWLGFWSFLLLASAALLKEGLRPALRPYLGAAGALWLCAGAWWGLRTLTGEAHPGVILAAEAEVRSGPGLRNPVSFKAPEGRRVSILGEKDGWLEIGVLKEGLKGWLPAGQVEHI